MTGSIGLCLTAILLLPLCTALLNFIGRNNFSRKFSGIFSTGSSLFGSIFAWTLFFKADLPVRILPGQWLNWGGLEINFELLLDHPTAYMLAMVTVLVFLLHLFLLNFLQRKNSFERILFTLDFFSFSIFLFICAGDIFLLLAGWIGLGVFVFLPGGFFRQQGKKLWAGRLPLQFNLTGDLFLGMAAVVIFSVTFQSQLVDLKINPGGPARLAGLLLFTGLIFKSGQFPFQFWTLKLVSLPMFILTVICVLQLPAVVYALNQLDFLWQSIPELKPFIQLWGAITALTSALLAASRKNYLEIIIFSTISQAGWLIVGLGNETASISHLILVSSANFLLLGGIAASKLEKIDKINIFSGRKIHVFSGAGIFILFGGLGISGLPFPGLPGISPARLHLALQFFERQPVSWIIFSILLLTVFLTGFYIFRIYLNLFSFAPKNTRSTFIGSSLLFFILTGALTVLVINTIAYYNFAGKTGFITTGIYRLLPRALIGGVLLAGIILAFLVYKTGVFEIKSENSLGTLADILYRLPKKTVDFSHGLFVKQGQKIVELMEELVEKIIFNGLPALLGASVEICGEFFNLVENEQQDAFNLKKVGIFIIVLLIIVFWISS